MFFTGLQYLHAMRQWAAFPHVVAFVSTPGFPPSTSSRSVFKPATCRRKVRVTCAANKVPSEPATSIRENIPMLLTWARVAAVPALTAVGLMPIFEGQRALLSSCFIAASVTDWADGYLARRWNVCSAFGAFLDPVADKLMVAAALILVCVRFGLSRAAPVIVASAIVILTREIFVSALREWMASAVPGGRDIVKVGFAGKVKTTSQMVALAVLLMCKDALSPFGMLGTVSLAVSAIMAVYSGLGYLLAALPTFRAAKE